MLECTVPAHNAGWRSRPKAARRRGAGDVPRDPRDWERFRVELVDILPQRRLVGRTIALYNPAQNRWLGVNNEGGAVSPSQGGAFNPEWGWERFEVHDVGNDQVGLRNPDTHRWLRVMDDRVDGFMYEDWKDKWGAERLQLRDAGDGHVGVYCPCSQRWVAVTPEGGTAAGRQGAGHVPRDPGNWERFRVEFVPGQVTPPPPAPAAARVKRWGDGLEAPAAGSRHFVPQGFVVTLDVPQAIGRFGHSASHVAQIMVAGSAKALSSPTQIAPAHAAALYAYTEQSPLYGMLNYTMRTPHTSSTPTDTELKRYADFIVHTQSALGCLPPHVSELQGKVYRGITVVLNNPNIYAPGKQITWQGFSSSTKNQTATLDFVNVLPGRKLSGSLFVIDSITAKDIRHFSAIPSEEEVLFPPNSQFKVEKVVTSEQEKKALLDQLGAYNMTDLDVYVLKQMA